MTEPADDPLASPLAGAGRPAACRPAGGERRGAVGLSGDRAVRRATGGRRAERGRPRRPRAGRVSGGRADPPRTLRTHHGLVVRGWHARGGGDRPGDRARRSVGRCQPGRTLAGQPASAAVRGRYGPTGHGGGCGGHAAAVRLGGGFDCAAHGRLAPLVRPRARGAGGTAACRTGAYSGGGSGAFRADRAVDDGLDLRTAA